ncbi:MAG: MmcB family DNA repair protein [Rhodospirillales bacterium]
MGEHSTNIVGTPRPGAAGLARGVARLLEGLGCRVLIEFPLGNGRRVDVAGLDRRGAFTVVEIKASLADFRADDKWPEYLGFCDRFYFAVASDFPLSVLPDDAGLIVADAYQGAVVRPAPPLALHAARRKALTIRFARTAAARLHGLLDPGRRVNGRQ